MVLVSVHDVKAETWSSPVVSQNKATALRDFSTAVNQKGSLLNSHPDDFILEQLGWFEPTSSALKVEHLVLGSGRDVFVEE